MPGKKQERVQQNRGWVGGGNGDEGELGLSHLLFCKQMVSEHLAVPSPPVRVATLKQGSWDGHAIC